MAAGFAIAIMVAFGLTLLPASIHDAQADPCSENVVESSVSEVDIDCEFYGPVEIYEHPGNKVPMDFHFQHNKKTTFCNCIGLLKTG